MPSSSNAIMRDNIIGVLLNIWNESDPLVQNSEDVYRRC